MPTPTLVTEATTLPIQERRANPDALATAPEGMAFLHISRTKWYELVDQNILPQPIKMGPSRNSAARWRWRDIYAAIETLASTNWNEAAS